ncbi:sulfite reductase (NADPH) flavoprotein alpha-component [Methylobacillus rhizosphaerae]|uniref:Sulfite reductase (NADPH) flavoprotein alpha-component n=1 Tax=Methylobacillus rhizosphaerae TaxID=551994 RepID=A0A238ZU14_9PROT|nr:flavodoxin domain-containing protein [Methylobacillus rhizosphaerae]SNR86244.1 sulfite reductase (NADPH) flavoprotein alpha-component [Methylobacillus rhizosphaerae]
MIVKTRPEIFKEEHWKEIIELTKRLDERQSIWLSGYLAGRVDLQPLTATTEAVGEIVICHGGETGNSKKIALQAEQKIVALGYQVKVYDLAQMTVRQFAKLRQVIIICSTHGDGDPPEPVTAFYNSLMSSSLPLEDMRYAVLALGDSSYEHFCVTGINIDEKLKQSGARSWLDRQECDTDFQKTADSWLADLVSRLPAIDSHDNAPAVVVAPETREIDRTHPATVKVLENIRLSSMKRQDAIHHLVFDLDEMSLAATAGDAVGIFVKNPMDMVTGLLQETNLKAEQVVSIDGASMPLVDALRDKLDITIPSRDFGQLWESLDTTGKFHEAMGDSEKSKKDFLKSKPLLELVKQFHVVVNAQQLVDVLRPLQPRLYDITNSLKQFPDEIHVCVKRYHYTKDDNTYQGVASNYIATLKADDAVEIFPHKHQRFHLPEDPGLPLILIADSTGIAPFIAFLQEIEAGERVHECWLIFSEMTFEEDFLYQAELIKFMNAGVLKHLHPVFYGDESDNEIFDNVVEHQDQFKQWINQGAHVYLSGDKSILTKAEDSIKSWSKSQDDVHWDKLATEKRLHKNLY